MHPPDDDTLLALLTRIGGGDKKALLELIELVGPWLHGTIHRMVSDRIAAGVLLEESFAEVWANAPLYDHYAGGPWTWLNTVARARAMDWRDKRRMKGKVPALADAAVRDDTRLTGMDADDVAILHRVFHDGLPGGASGAADRARFDEALGRLADGH